MAGSKLLITGGAGFLGYYLVQAILHWNARPESIGRPIQLTIYDNYIRGVPDWLIRLSSDKVRPQDCTRTGRNLSAGRQDLTLIRHDITQPLPQDIDDFQYIIHAASIASPIYYRLHPIETMDANVNGLRFLLEYCREQQEKAKPVKGFLFFSTSEIYGDPVPGNIPTPESYRGNVSSTGPRACYDESKRYGETLCVNFAREYDLPIKIARPFNNYGPGLKITDRRVLPDFARDALAAKDIIMLSDGSPTRTFCYVADAVVGYYKILVNGRSGQAYNIGVDQPEISIADLAERVVALARDLWDYKGKVVRHTSPDQDYLIDNPNRRCPVIDKARNDLGYTPGISLDEGLRRSLIWYIDNRQAEEA
jgi:dTDP-glucose 4,6-dehydratase/UDP-glucuronate decarboxylase